MGVPSINSRQPSDGVKLEANGRDLLLFHNDRSFERKMHLIVTNTLYNSQAGHDQVHLEKLHRGRIRDRPPPDVHGARNENRSKTKSRSQ